MQARKEPDVYAWIAAAAVTLLFAALALTGLIFHEPGDGPEAGEPEFTS